MGYNVGEGVLDYSYCEEDVVNSAKANIRGFIHIIIGAIIGLGLLSFLLSTILGTLSCLGGCLGCSACIETAACADDCSCVDCDYESLTEEQVYKANDRVSCDGYDCCGREGCLACGGCGDCSECSGYDYDTYTIVVGSTSKEITTSDIDSIDYVNVGSFMSSAGMEAPYYTFLGLFDEDGDRYVNEYGTVEKKLKDGLVLYAKFEEANLGVQYELYFDMSELGMDGVRIAVTVGGAMPTFPEVPEKDGYRFKGWYIGTYFFGDGTNLKTTFHLKDFKMNPNNSNRVCTLTPKYEAKTQKVEFYVNGSYCMAVEAPFETTLEDVFQQFYNKYHNYSQMENFFGWATEPDAEPNEKISGEALLTEDMKLYAIIREARIFQFFTNNGNRSQRIDVKFHEGATNVVFNDVEELQWIKEESAYPGYKFVGWYTTSAPSSYDQPTDTIDRIDSSTPYIYYAKWEKANYTLTYWVMDYKAGELSNDFNENYYMGDTHALVSKDVVRDNVGYEFEGWCFDEDCAGTVYTDYLPTDTYGNKNLYAKYNPDTYEVNLRARGGAFVGGSNAKTDYISYGGDYSLTVPEREGYDFVGWFYGDYQAGEGDQVTDEQGKSLKPFTLETLGYAITQENEERVNKKFSLFAKWTIKVFEIEFVANDMTHETCRVEWGKTIAKTMPDPEKEGHTFQYWTYADGSRYYDTHVIKDGANSYVVDGKVVLTAVFTINMHTVTFVIDGVQYAKKVAWGTTLADAEKLLQEPSYSGTPRRRAGWFNNDAFEVQMQPDEQVKENVTLYAKYDYAKKFTFYGASGTMERHYFVGDKETFPTDSKKGYTFEGWCEDSSLTSTPITGDVRIEDAAATEYYAKHKTISYKLEYYLSATDAQPWKTDTYTVEDVKDLIAVGDNAAPKKTGYTFAGWTLNGMATSQLVNMTEDKKLVAIFNANTYAITLAAEGNNNVKYATYDATFDLGVPSNKVGYDFVGWAWEAGAYEADVVTDNTGKSLTGVVFQIAEDTTAYPVFRVKQYSAFWTDPDGERVIEQTVIRHFEYVQAPTNPIKEGYTFAGWYQDKACTQEYDFYASTVTGDVRVWAKFTINSYSVTFVVDTGLHYVANDLVYNTSLRTAMQNAQPTVDQFVAETGARFKGWFTDDGGNYTADDVVPARNLTLTAKFHMPITVRYHLHDDSVHEVGPYYAGDTIYAYSSYTRNGYSFDGWYTDSNAKQSFPMTADENTPEIINLHARWTANTYNIYYYVDSTWSYAHASTYTMDATQKYGGLELWMPDAKEGKVFKGWYVGYSTSGRYLGDTLNNFGLADSEVLYGNLTLYGVWEDVQYSVKFFVDGAEQAGLAMKYTYGATLKKVNFIPTAPVGKEFDGWVIKGTDVQVIDNQGNWIDGGTYRWKEDLVLVAVFITI